MKGPFLNNFIALTLSFIFTMAKVDTVATEGEQAVSGGVQSLGPWGIWVTGLVSALTIAAIAGLLIWAIVKSMKKRYIAENGVVEDIVPKTEDGRKIVDIPLTVGEDGKSEGVYSIQKPEKFNAVALTLFVLAGVWVSFEWIARLISGLMN